MVVQCKRYSHVIGSNIVRELYGSVEHEQASKGILITTSHFSPDAVKWADGKRIELVDRKRLDELFHRYGLM